MMSLWGLGLALLAVTAKQVHAAQNLNSEATTKQIRMYLCECFKNAIPIFGVKLDKAKRLPLLCNVDHPRVPIDPKTDCSRIS
ncbi:hypothetical protein GH714_020906 [Hevea brasiliensis]|uniref:Bifunctional inhibitor/plant lipid transfer protein/seed storage helical domain-containing protein n=1 Tax=Hevea brasiliensis TaxID=3981 RepID=A0A6A6LD77_HEVBR|nr:hypothetical protein GH714_020906 [Hevea brasiliensis]